MITVFVLIAARPGVTAEVLAQLRNISGVKRVYEVMGPYDIILEIEVASIGEVPLVLGADIRTIRGIQSTTSLVALPDPADSARVRYAPQLRAEFGIAGVDAQRRQDRQRACREDSAAKRLMRTG